MSLSFYFEENERLQTPPDELAHEANSTATKFNDARRSREYFEMGLKKFFAHEVYKKLQEASQSRRLILYGILTVVFLLTVYFEWDISQEIYEVLLSGLPVVPFIVFTGVGFYISAIFAEYSSHFSLYLQNHSKTDGKLYVGDRVVEKLYDRKSKNENQTNWYFHPIFGLILGFALLFAIYLISEQRVEYLKAAGELNEDRIQAYLPIALYAMEILFGIPAYFFLVWCQNLVTQRRKTRELTKARDFELILRDSAIQSYTAYMSKLVEYNQMIKGKGIPPRAMIPSNKSMRQLLIDEFGFDPTKTDSHSDSDSGDESSDSYVPVDSGPVNPPQSSAGNGPDNNSEDHHQDSRINDLLNLMDDQIDHANTSI